MDIEKTISDYYHIDERMFYSDSRNRLREESEALHFLWFILHTEKGYSVNRLAREYDKIPRTVYYGIAKIKIGIATQEYYKKIYSELMEKIKGDSD